MKSCSHVFRNKENVFFFVYLIFSSIQGSWGYTHEHFFTQFFWLVVIFICFVVFQHFIKIPLLSILIILAISVFLLFTNPILSFLFASPALLFVFLPKQEKKNSKPDTLNTICLIFSGIISVFSVIATYTIWREKSQKLVYSLVAAACLSIFIVIIIKNIKSIDHKMTAKNKKALTANLVISMIGILSSAFASCTLVYYGIGFFPWFLLLLCYDNGSHPLDLAILKPLSKFLSIDKIGNK